MKMILRSKTQLAVGLAAVVAIAFVTLACSGSRPATNKSAYTPAASNESGKTALPPPAETKGSSRAPARQSLTIGYTALDAGYGGLYIAKEKGFFEKYGLNIGELKYIPGAPTMSAALVSGEVDLTAMAPPAIFVLTLEGVDAMTIGAMMNVMPYLIISRPEITEPQQLAGKKIGVTQIGDASHAATKYLLDRWGVGKDKVTYLASGAMPQRVAAFESKAIDSTLLPPSYVSKITAPYKIVSNPWEEKVPWLQLVLATRKSFLKEKPDALKKAIQAVAEGNYFGMANPKEAKEVLAKVMKLGSEPEIEAAYKSFRGNFVADLRPNPEAMMNIIKYDTAASRPEAASKGIKDFMDSQILDELDAAGFFTQLKEKYPPGGN